MTLNERIAHFYDTSTQLWLDTWGEHMHHGHYGPDGTARKDHQQAQLDLVHELLQWGGVESASHILDAGCGVGGSARHLSKLFGAEVLGLTLSPVQAAEAGRYNLAAGLQKKVTVRAQDVYQLTPADGPFDLIWSLESAEHMADKRALLELFHSLLAPGGKLLMATWCHHDEPPALTPDEQKLLEKIYRVYHLPPMCSTATLGQLAGEVGFANVSTADWSDAVAPFWQAVIRSALSWRSVRGLLRSGRPAMQGAWAMRYMTQGYRRGTIKFGLIQGQRP